MTDKRTIEFAIIGAIVLLTVFVTSYYFLPKEQEEQILQDQEQVFKTQDWIVYTDNSYKFSFDYPAVYAITPGTSVEDKGRFKGLELVNAKKSFNFHIRVEKGFSDYKWIGINSECFFEWEYRVFKCKYSNQEVRPSIFTKSGHPIYRLEDGDVGAFVRNYFIPNYGGGYWTVFELTGDFNSIDAQKLSSEWAEFEKNFNVILKSFTYGDVVIPEGPNVYNIKTFSNLRGKVGEPYEAMFTSEGAPYFTWLLYKGALPPGLELMNAYQLRKCGEKGACKYQNAIFIYGTPIQAGVYTFILEVLDAGSSPGFAKYTIIISE